MPTELRKGTCDLEHGPLRILEIGVSGTVGTSDTGPVSRTIRILSNQFSRLGHRVTVADAPASEPRGTLDPDVRVVNVGRHSIRPQERRFIRPFVRALAYVGSLLWRIRRYDYDVIHIHHSLIAVAFALLSRAPYYYSSHTSTWALELEQGKRLTRGRRLQRALESFVIRRSRATIASGDYLGRQMPGAIVATIPNGIDTARWNRLDRTASRTVLGIANEEFVILFVGRIDRVKGVDVLIDAARELASELPDLRVIIIGSPGGDFHLRTQASTYATNVIESAKHLPVRFTGFLDNNSIELRQYLSACDVAVFPSRYECLGNVALEALAMSVPVIASRTGGLASIVTDDVGYLVPPGDPQALADAIRSAHKHPERLAALRPNCRKHVIEQYSHDLCVTRHLTCFRANLHGSTGEA